MPAPRGTILTFTNITPGHTGSYGRVTIDASAVRAGDMVALFPVPVTETVVLEPWSANGGTLVTGYGAHDVSPTAQLTITSIA